jgi:deoxyribonuclease V
VDVDYRGRLAVAAGLWFRGWAADEPEHQAVAVCADAAGYEPGAFYRRELPALLAVLGRGPRPDVVIVDGYVWLADRAAGLGARLHAEVGGVVVGVAKTRYAGATAAVEVCRGGSRSPLFVSAVGVSAAEAATKVAAMHGPYRVPTLLKRVDALARSAVPDDRASAS